MKIAVTGSRGFIGSHLKTRLEKDSMGEVKVPENAMYGASTARAVENFQNKQGEKVI